MRNSAGIFIASTNEKASVAFRIKGILDDLKQFKTTTWKYGAFRSGDYPMEVLERQLEANDFAIVLLTPDDITLSRGQTSESPRDNIVFEIGLFMGALGRKNVFCLFDENSEIKIPSDLKSMTMIPYRSERPDNPTKEELAPSIDDIVSRIEELLPNQYEEWKRSLPDKIASKIIRHNDEILVGDDDNIIKSYLPRIINQFENPTYIDEYSRRIFVTPNEDGTDLLIHSEETEIIVTSESAWDYGKGWFDSEYNRNTVKILRFQIDGVDLTDAIMYY
jgi:molybdopterin converting factor small subunit